MFGRNMETLLVGSGLLNYVDSNKACQSVGRSMVSIVPFSELYDSVKLTSRKQVFSPGSKGLLVPVAQPGLSNRE